MTPAGDPWRQNCFGMTVPGRAVPVAEPPLPHARGPRGDAELVEDGEADPFAEDALGVAGDLLEQGVIDRGHREEGGAGLALDAGVEGGGFVVESLGPGDLKSHEVDEGLAAGAVDDV